MANRRYTFIDKNGAEHTTNNISEFCREHQLQRRHMNEVVGGSRQSHRGWSMKKPDQPATALVPADPEDDTVSLETVLQHAEIAAKSVGDPVYEQIVMKRIEKLRRGEPLQVEMTESGPVPVD